MKSALTLLKEFGEEESRIFKGDIEFTSPIFNNKLIAMSIKGLVYKFKTTEINPGWYQFKPNNSETVKVVRNAYPEEISEYLKKFPIIRLVLSHKINGVYYAFPQKNNKLNLSHEKPILIYLTDDTVLDFDMVIGRFDGANIWYETIEVKNDPSKSNYLRESYAKTMSPTNIKFKGLNIEEKIAYSFRFSIDKEIKKQLQKKGLEQAVTHAGGELISYHERSDSYKVTYKVDGEEFTSFVSKYPSYSVITAGICLNGHDNEFDLASLVCVLREGRERSLIHRTR